MHEVEALKAAVAARAGQDPAFRAALLANPQAAVEQLLGTALPPHVKVEVREEPADTYVLVLPRPAAGDGELSDDELEAVAGGSKKGAKKFFSDALDATKKYGSMANDMAGGLSAGLTIQAGLTNTGNAFASATTSNSKVVCGTSDLSGLI